KIYEGKPKELKIGIKETQERIKNFGTLGNYLYNENPHKTRLRNRYTTRKMYIDEFNIIWENQRKYYPDILTENLKSKIGDSQKGILFFQRPLRSQKHLIGKCTFEPKKSKCSTSTIEFEKFRMYQFINGIECNGKKLNTEQRKLITEIFNSKSKFKFREIKKKLKFTEGRFNYNDDDNIIGNNTISNFSKIFGKEKWNKLNSQEQFDIWFIKNNAEDKEWLTNYAKTKWDLAEDKIEKLLKINLSKNYSNLSLKAINNILPYLEKGFIYSDAVLLGGLKSAFGSDRWNSFSSEDKKNIEYKVFKVGEEREDKVPIIEKVKELLKSQFNLDEKQLDKLYHHSFLSKINGLKEKLPEPENIRNPIVQQALYELRKLVNAIIDVHGKTDKIKVELARDLKSSKDKRYEVRQENRKNENRNDEIKKRLDEFSIEHSRTNIQKVILWDESQNYCPYTGQKIGFEELFNDGYVQIEHIIPYSISLNDSMQNKTLCLADENKRKGNKTPYQFYGHDENKWSEVKNMVYELIVKKGNSQLYKKNYRKYQRFISKQLPDADEFIQRQLNDTRYISKSAKEYLKNICDDVDVTQGTVTSLLRHHWGLDNILNDVYITNGLTDGDYYAAVNDEDIIEILKWNAENKEKDLDHLKKLGKVVQGKIKDGKLYPYKNRDDHRHHAVDAVTVALTKKSYLQQISRMSARNSNYENIKTKIRIDKPWEGFWQDADNSIKSILVSHKINNKVLTPVNKRLYDAKGKVRKINGKVIYGKGDAVRGALHKETVYGKHVDANGEEFYHVRKPLESITTKTLIDKIVDENVRKIMLQKLKNDGVDVNKNKFNIPNNSFFKYDDKNNKTPLIFLPNKKGEHVPIRKVRIKEKIGNAEKLKEINQYVNPRNNHHIIIYKDSKGNYKEKVVTLWEAVERIRQGLTLINKNPEPDCEFITSLTQNEMFLLGLTEEEIKDNKNNVTFLSQYLHKVQKIAGGDYFFEICFKKHLDSRMDKEAKVDYKYVKGFGDGKTGWVKLNPVKVKVNISGKFIFNND
ncbi:MAG TPA: type II CRISPR RNA-guided endonuclease Cas9, partial [Ignavibacteria bacterium]|nr:type II CRISPR RNA-guided endonuclease Cas9 [Ignavibacteria bacterium]